jgi:hypothetical protein
MTPPFRLTFPRSASPAYPDTVRLAKQSPAYVELGESGGRRVLHEAVFGTTADEVGALAELWGLVQAWKGTRLEVDGAGGLPRERRPLGEVLACMTRAATFSPPARYCASGVPEPAGAPWPGRPALPCRLAQEHLRLRLDTQVVWTDPACRVDQVRALLLEAGLARCPFLQLGGSRGRSGRGTLGPGLRRLVGRHLSISTD